jgi:adenylyl- and sulfurtransferase ThiI
MKVEDPDALMRWLTERVAQEPGSAAAHVFDFTTPRSSKPKRARPFWDFLPKLADKSFHVRMHRRGFRRQLSAHEEERRLGAVLFEALAAAGTPATVEFASSDAIVVIETVGDRAGVSFITHEDMQHCPLLRFD